jgi:hypothetical protein
LVKSVSFSPYGGDTIKALQARQASLQQNAPELPSVGNMRSGWQGASYLANTLVNTLQQNAAAGQERNARTKLAELISGHAAGQPWSPEEIGNVYQYEPELGAHIMDLEAARQLAAGKQENWTAIPTPEGENGQWFQNTVTGEQKKVGGGTDSSAWKPSDIAARADDYTKAASLYTTASQSWQSMVKSAQIALSPKAATEGKGAADYDMIVGWAKLLDPNSVVRDTEVDSASMTGGMIGQINGWLNTLKSRGSLDDATRKAIMTQAGFRVQSYYDQAKSQHDWISDVATRHKVDPNDVVPPLAEFVPWTPPEAAPAVPDPDVPAPEETPDPVAIPYPPKPANWPADVEYPKEENWNLLTAEGQAKMMEYIKVNTPRRKVPGVP